MLIVCVQIYIISKMYKYISLKVAAFVTKSGKQSRQRRGPLATFATKSTTNPQNGQISVVVLTIRLFFVSVRPVEAFEWAAGGIVERGFGFQSITLSGNASHFLKR